VSVLVEDRFGAAGDEAMPQLVLALDPEHVREEVLPVARPDAPRPDVELQAIRVLRHKPGRRCLLAYDLFDPRAETCLRIVAKLRARGADVRTHALNQQLWDAGFRGGAARAFAVPEPLGVVPRLGMVLQAWCEGESAERALDGADGLQVARHTAEALHSLHATGIPTHRSHDIGAELAILRERLARAAQSRPAWTARIESVREACEALARCVPPPTSCGLHRDFYPEQILVDRETLTLLDLDLYAAGDPALDVGNFSAHLTERSLRLHGKSAAGADRVAAFERRYRQLAPDVPPESIEIYGVLALARHIQISTTFPQREHATPLILDEVEERLVRLRS
jgi:hypothetical protein